VSWLLTEEKVKEVDLLIFTSYLCYFLISVEKIFFRGSISLLIFLILLVSPSFLFRVSAQSFNPTFGVVLSDSTAGAHPNIRLLVVQDDPLDDPFKKVVFTIPAGFDIASSASLAASVPPGFPLEPATGNLSMSGFDGGVQIFNVADAQGHKALWRMVPGPTTVDIIVDGDSTSGHTVTFEWPAEFVPTLFGPISRFELIINGQTNAPAAPKVVTNPSVGGDYTFQAQLTSILDTVATRQIAVGLPATPTPTGDDVTANFNNGSSVTFSSVTSSGTTTIQTSSEAPPEGTGQFQLSGGLYYDFNTSESLTFSCPCTITLPYDPDTTPNPKIYHQEEGVWIDVTTSVDTINHTVTGIVSSFSFFASAQSNFQWRSPVKALLVIDNPMRLSRDQTLPLNFEINDANGNLIEPDGVYFQLVKTHDANGQPLSSAQFEANISTEIVNHKYYTAKLDLHSLNLPDGQYRLRVYTGNTITNAADFVVVP